MQSIIVLTLLLITGLFSAIELTRNSPEEINNFASFRSDQVAGNIMQYDDFLAQYLVANYDELHEFVSNSPGNVEAIKVIDNIQDLIIMYSQKNFQMFLNYQSIVFNYTNLSVESQSYPTLYLATTWNDFLPNKYSFSSIKMPEIMGSTNQLLSQRLYQGNSTYWTVPVLFSQFNCNVIEIYSQVPTDSNGNSQLVKIRNLFNKLCNQIQINSSFKFLDYVFLEPIFKSESLE